MFAYLSKQDAYYLQVSDLSQSGYLHVLKPALCLDQGRCVLLQNTYSLAKEDSSHFRDAFSFTQGCILFQAGIVVCCQQKNMLTGHRVDRKIFFLFSLSQDSIMLSSYSRSKIARTLHLEY